MFISFPMSEILVQSRISVDLNQVMINVVKRKQIKVFGKIRFPTFIQNIFHIDQKKHSRIIPYIYERYGI